MSKGTVNKVLLIGRLGKDPEIRTITSGAKVATVSMATNESYKQGDEWKETTEWHNLVLWRQKAEYAEKFFKKGMRIYIEGKLQTRQWQDKNSVQHYTTEIIVTDAQILESVTGSKDSGIRDDYPSTTDLGDIPNTMDESGDQDVIPF